MSYERGQWFPFGLSRANVIILQAFIDPGQQPLHALRII